MVSEVAIAAEREKWLALPVMMAIARMKLMMRMQTSQVTLVWTPPGKLDVAVLTVMVAAIRKE